MTIMRLPYIFLLLLCIACSELALASAPPPPPSGMILRIRLEDGSMEKIQVASEDISLNQVLKRFSPSTESTILVGTKRIDDASQSISTLGLKNGSIITIRASNKKTTEPPSFALPKETFQPFPDLAKNLQSAIRARARQRTGGSSSYTALANLHDSLHVVEHQPKGTLQRVYMCATSAQRFSQSGSGSRVGLLLGTVQRERVELKPAKARTSLSSKPSAQDFCQVCKVHALWEPPQQQKQQPPNNDDDQQQQCYDATSLLERDDSVQRIIRVASYLGLQPIGWIFTYSDNRHEDNGDGLPVFAPDIKTGALLQIQEMKLRQQQGADFVTVAMDATSGATEAFQLSNVAVQMVSEGMLLDDGGRHVSTSHAIVVDGRETKSLDTVLCLVNSALLSHEGLYAGSCSTKKPTKKNGSLTIKTRKALLQALDESSTLPLLNILSDFHILVALDVLLLPEETQDLCRVVQKWARGQKQGTQLPSTLKRKLTLLLQQ